MQHCCVQRCLKQAHATFGLGSSRSRPQQAVPGPAVNSPGRPGPGARSQRRAVQVVALTGIPTAPCNTPWGDHLISLAVQNKQDWARLHGHELHLMAASTDVRIRPGAWQKVALLRQVRPAPPPSRAGSVDAVAGPCQLGCPAVAQQACASLSCVALAVWVACISAACDLASYPLPSLAFWSKQELW